KLILCNSRQYLEFRPGALQRYFFKTFHFQPLAIDISFCVDAISRPHSIGTNPIVWLVTNLINTLITMLGDIESAPMRFNSFSVENAYGGTETLINPIVSHYRQQALREGFKLFGSLNLLGNPMELVGNVGTGVKDFFYEPAQGLVESPMAFTRGISKGTSSLVSKTISGVFGAASKVTTTVSQATQIMTLDEDYQAERRIQQARGKPKHVGDGFVRGVTSLGTNGAMGIGKGLVQGVTGLVFKPLTGVVDLASNTLNGIANTATFIDMSSLPPIERKRLPRLLRPGVAMKPFSAISAQYQNILWEIGKCGLDDEQTRNVGALELVEMREHERLMVAQPIQNEEYAVLAKKVHFEEDTKEKKVQNVEKIISAYFGVSHLQFRSTVPKHTTMTKTSINVTEIVRKHLDETDNTLDLEGLKPMRLKFGDFAPEADMWLYILYIPTKAEESFVHDDLLGSLSGPRHGLKFLKSSRVLANCEVSGTDVILRCYCYVDLQDTSPVEILRVKQTIKTISKDMDLNVCYPKEKT
ncbi:vacuolar protein sorting-associated protein 13 family protein, partial [Reticulomyxa filosa]